MFCPLNSVPSVVLPAVVQMLLPLSLSLLNTLYVMFDLFGDWDTTTGFFIPKAWHISFLLLMVAVAVNAINRT